MPGLSIVEMTYVTRAGTTTLSLSNFAAVKWEDVVAVSDGMLPVNLRKLVLTVLIGHFCFLNKLPASDAAVPFDF